MRFQYPFPDLEGQELLLIVYCRTLAAKFKNDYVYELTLRD